MWYTSDPDPERASSAALYAYTSFQSARTRLEEMRLAGADPHAIEMQERMVIERARKVNETYQHMKDLDKTFGHGRQVHTPHSWRNQ